jgi:aspartate aminotransferase
MLNEAGVATVAGTSFGAMGEGFIRFSYAASVQDIERACDKLRAMLA